MSFVSNPDFNPFQINPDLPETEELKAWYLDEEDGSNWTSLTQAGSRGSVVSAGDFGLNSNMKTVMVN